MWKVYLDMKDYASALANCWDPLQRDQVYLVQVQSWSFSALIFFLKKIIIYEKKKIFKLGYLTSKFMIQAEAAFTSREFLRAASFYAKVSCQC